MINTQRLKQDPVKNAAVNLKSAERMKKHRDLLKQSVEKSNDLLSKSAFKTRQIKGKSIKKIANAIPKDPEKQKEVLEALCSSKGVQCKRAAIPLPDSRKHDLVKEFYCKDDISRVSPSTKDVMNVQVNGVVSKLNVRFLLYSVKEVYEQFKQGYPDEVLSISQFHRLKPINVRSASDAPHNVCCCMIHENMRYALSSLTDSFKTLCPVINVGYDMDKNFVCERPDLNCFNEGAF